MNMPINVLICCDHIGLYISPVNTGKRIIEASLFNVTWSPKGTGTTAFLRFSADSGLYPYSGIYTDNTELFQYQRKKLFKPGKPQHNIVNSLTSPVILSEFKRQNNLPEEITETIIFNNGSFELSFVDVQEMVHFNSFIAESTSFPHYSCASGSPIRAIISVNNKKVIEVKPNESDSNNTECFIALSEMWFD